MNEAIVTVVYVNTERPRDKMENSKKGKDSSVQKESVSDSFKSQVGECLSFWLLRGPPFDQRDYMMSPSETPSAVSSEPVSESLKKKKLGPSDIKIDSKYLIDSQKALKKISELIKDESVEHLVERIEDLINFFLQGSPLGFLVEDLPTVIEIVEFFARNRGSVPKFGDFVKTIMSYASEPPKVGKTSDMLNCKQALTDYFTLFAELLATFEDECFQLHLLEALDCLIIRRKLVDVCSVKLSFCHEAMEDSQLPCVVGSLMETVPASLYLHYLELSLQMVWVSIKTGYLMAEIGVVEFVICRMEGLPSTEEDVLPKQKEKESSEQYRLLDKSAYLIWSLFAIASKYNARIPAPSKQALWKLKCLFHCEIQKRWQKATNVRNNLAAILTKLYAFFRENSTFQQVGLVADIAALAVATEIKPNSTWLAEVEFSNSQDDYLFKEIMLLCCCLFAGNKELILTLESQKVVEGVLRLINPKTTLLWIPSQFSMLLLIGFRTLSELVPRLPDSYLSSKGNRRLLSTVKWLMGEYFDQEPLLEALKTLCIIVTCDCEPIIEDAKAQGGVQILLDVCFRLLDVTFMKLEHQDKLAKIFLTLERLFRNDRKVQEKFADSCVSISVKLFRRILADSENDSKWNSNLLVSFGGFLWEAVAWCSSSLKTFVEKSGIFLLLDFIESSFFPIQMLFLGILVDMTDEGETVAHLLTWRGKRGSGILSLLIDIWRKEEFLNKVHRTKDGLIQDVEAPLVTEEQWYLTHQVTGSHIYSPSIAEMMCSVRPKIHALYQFLQCRYYDLTQLGESTYSLQMKMIEPRYQVYIPLIEHYLALKMGEIWSEVIRDALISGVAPTSFNGEVMCTLLDEKNKWAARIKTMQEELLLKNRSGEAGEEKEFYAFLRDSRLASALEAVRELDYIARTSFKKFQKRKKMKQISQRERFLTKCRFSEGRFYHSTFLKNTNTTFSRGENIWMVSERRVTPREQIALVSPESCGDNRFEDADDI